MKIEIVNYSEKAIAVFGDTREFKDSLKAYGKWNRFLKRDGQVQPGWIFSKRYETEVSKLLNIVSEVETKEEPNEIIFQNEKTVFCFNKKNKSISGHDLTDANNQPKCYSTKSRGFAKALNEVKSNWNESLSMYQVMRLIDNHNMGMRSYCAMD